MFHKHQIDLDPYFKHYFAIKTLFGFVSVLESTALFKLEIIVCFLCLLLPVH